MLDAWFQKIILLGYDFFVAAIIRYVAKAYLFGQFVKFLVKLLTSNELVNLFMATIKWYWQNT